MKGQGSLGALNAAHTIDTNGEPDAKIGIAGVFTATVVAEFSEDNGATWSTAPILKSDGTIAQSMTAAGTYRAIGLPRKRLKFRTRVSAYTSGSVTPTVTLE